MEQEFSGGNLVIRVAGVIQEVLDSMVDELRESGPRSNLLADLLEHSLGQVNFDEIAENFLGY